MKIKKNRLYYKGDRQDILRFIPTSSKRILEVGCGEGAFAKSLLSNSHEVWGVEFNEDAAKKASEILYKVYADAIENVMRELPDNYFDLIIFNDVLEHLVEPNLVLSNIRKKLIIGGKVIASIPNIRFAKVLFNLIVKKDFTYTEFGVLDSSHLRFFTINSMKALFSDSGYKIVHIEGINKSPSILTRAFVLILSILTLRNNSDALFPQFVITAKAKSL